MNNTEQNKQLPTPEEIFEQQNPQDGTLAPWAKRVAQAYAREVVEYTLQQAADIAVTTENEIPAFVEVDKQSILSLKEPIFKELKL